MSKINFNKNELFEEADSIKNAVRESGVNPEKERQLIDEHLRVVLNYTSNALDGNTFGESDARSILKDGIAIGGKKIEEHNEILGNDRAFSYMLECASVTPLKLSEELICHMHMLYYAGIDIGNAGIYKREQNFIDGTDYTPPSPKVTPTLMKTFINDMNSQHEAYHPIEYSAVLHKRLLDIHPFISGNGRVARLLNSMVTLNTGYGLCLIAPELLDDYSEALRTAQLKNDMNYFVCLIGSCVVETQKIMCRKLGIQYN